MARAPKRVWQRSRRRLLTATANLLTRLVADRDREVLKAAAGKTPLYLAPVDDVLWTKITAVQTALSAALVATA